MQTKQPKIGLCEQLAGQRRMRHLPSDITWPHRPKRRANLVVGWNVYVTPK